MGLLAALATTSAFVGPQARLDFLKNLFDIWGVPEIGVPPNHPF